MVGTAFFDFAFVTHIPPGPEQAPNAAYFHKRNVETPCRSLHGQQAARSAYGGPGTGTGRKRMPGCNGRDTGCNITRRESGRLPHGLSSPGSWQNHLYGRNANECSNTGACALQRDVGRHQLGQCSTPGKRGLNRWETGGWVTIGPVCQPAIQPPSTIRLMPVTYVARSLPRNTAAPATSSGRPSRGHGVRLRE